MAIMLQDAKAMLEGAVLDAGQVRRNVVWPPPNLHQVYASETEHWLFSFDLLVVLQTGSFQQSKAASTSAQSGVHLSCEHSILLEGTSSLPTRRGPL